MNTVPPSASPKCLVALDPGSEKCGFAVIRYDLTCLERGVVFVSELNRLFRRVFSDYHPSLIIVGNGTAAGVTMRIIGELSLDVEVRAGDERNTTFEARSRYFQDHPPRGFWRFVPLSLQFPPRPLDDYAAQLIGERYLAQLDHDGD